MFYQSNPNSMPVLSSVPGSMTDEVVNRAATMRICGKKTRQFVIVVRQHLLLLLLLLLLPEQGLF